MKIKNTILVGLLTLPLLASCNSGLASKGTEITRNEVLNTIAGYNEEYIPTSYKMTSTSSLDYETFVTIYGQSQSAYNSMRATSEMAYDLKEAGNFYVYQKDETIVTANSNGQISGYTLTDETWSTVANGSYTLHTIAPFGTEQTEEGLTDSDISLIAHQIAQDNRLTESLFTSIESRLSNLHYYRNSDNCITIEGDLPLSSLYPQMAIIGNFTDIVTMTYQFESEGYLVYSEIPSFSIEGNNGSSGYTIRMKFSGLGTVRGELNGSILRRI